MISLFKSKINSGNIKIVNVICSGIICVLIFIATSFTLHAQTAAVNTAEQRKSLTFFKADNPYIQYTGRIDFSNPLLPRFWAPGVYIKAKFKGALCEIILNDEVADSKNHNYIEVIIDNKKPFRIQITGKTNTIKAAGGLSDGAHTIIICKNTESGIGYVEFAGLRCKGLYIPDDKPLRKIEFIGNSITCGTGSDLSKIPCNKGQWYDQQNAYYSYGPATARNLKAQWQVSAVSGIGLINSCCNMNITMPQVFDKVNMRSNAVKWNFKKYEPQAVTVCLGQNDGLQDSAKFCKAYIQFIKDIRKRYSNADIICLTSPMADASLTKMMKSYLTGVVAYMNEKGDKKITKYFFSRQYNHGCGSHPNLKEHQQIAKELTEYIRNLKGW